MKTCKNCKWWGKVFEGTCDFVETIHAENPLTGFFVVADARDDTGLSARLLTRPDFGCVNFTKLERKRAMYQRKTRDEFEIQGNYGYGNGWECLITEETREAARGQLKCYQENEPGTAHRIKCVRVQI